MIAYHITAFNILYLSLPPSFSSLSLVRYKNAKRISQDERALARERLFRRDVHPEPVWRVFRCFHCDRRGTRSSWKTVTKVDRGEKKKLRRNFPPPNSPLCRRHVRWMSTGINCGQAWTPSSATLYIAGTWRAYAGVSVYVCVELRGGSRASFRNT